MNLSLRNIVESRKTPQAGQGQVEYALIIVLVSIAAIVTMGLLGGSIAEVFGTVKNAI